MAKAKRRKADATPPPPKPRKRRRKIDPRTGKPFRNPTVEAAEQRGEKIKMLQDPKTGRILPGNPTAYKPGQPKSGPGRASMMSHAFRRLLGKDVPTKVWKKIKGGTDPNAREYCDALAFRIANIGLLGGERYAILAAAEIRQATEGSRVQHAKDDWKEELAALGLDPDEALARIEELLTQMVEEANVRDGERMGNEPSDDGGEESSPEEAGIGPT